MPLPPHVTLEQARNYLKAILKGDPDAMRIIKAKEILAWGIKGRASLFA